MFARWRQASPVWRSATSSVPERRSTYAYTRRTGVTSGGLQNRTLAVLVNGKTSKETPVLPGVPQGTVLGPLLFPALTASWPWTTM